MHPNFIAGNIPKIVDHSKGVYMHDHPDFPSVIGGRFIYHYLLKQTMYLMR